MRGAKVVNLSLSAALLAGVALVAGCGDASDNNNVRTQSLRGNNRNYDVNSLNEGNRLFSRSAGNGQDQRIRSLRYSPALSNKVAQLRDVQTAHVVVTDRDAYVGVTLHGNNTTGRTTAYGMQRPNGIGLGTTNVGGPYGADYGTRGNGDNGLARGTGRTGGLFDLGGGGLFGADRDANRTGTGTGSMLGTGTTGNRFGSMYPGGNMGMSSVNRGAGTMNGAGTNNGTMNTPSGVTAGNGALGAGTDNVSQDLKNRIESAVKQTAPHIRNVYVSGDSDFVSRIGDYGTQSRGGGTLNNFISDFETMINRVFPGRAGTMTGPNGYAPTRPNAGMGNGTGTMDTNGTGARGSNAGFTGGTTR
ncbi:MAG: YhcN/YlaJ family sporulation lipoprotein [Paenibacillus sp.]|uniref:YhcN/YlaJ family sporulation lipoprotein n=1 Tax=Paenibacillus sp. TaxID=58172 RepID=UPI00290D7450|nr:YhcN/YlaJ family sporulation lipoprotein [Paenibacillus sp.]MDU4696626.1 YhcN/YlaJ family sporulation lipoprotein [Paenibacillus sp.]